MYSISIEYEKINFNIGSIKYLTDSIQRLKSVHIYLTIKIFIIIKKIEIFNT